MGITLLAAAVPAIQQPAAFSSITDNYNNGASAVMLNSYKVPDATTPTYLSGPFNANATRADLTGRYGGGNVYAILTGLAISVPGSGLLLPVTKGHARIDGITEVNANTTLAVPDNTARVYIWLSQNGTLDKTSTTTPPAGAQCFLGSCVTSGGNITSIDTSGVCYVYGGQTFRQTADNGMPADTPPSSAILVHKTAFNTYFWNGAAYTPLFTPQVTADPATPQNGDQWYRTDTAAFSLQSGGATVTIPISTAIAPSSAHYVTTQAESGLSAEVSLGALAAGMLKHTVSSSVSTPATATEGTDYWKPGGTDVAVADGGTGGSTAGAARTNLGLAIGTDVLSPTGNGSGLSGVLTTAGASTPNVVQPNSTLLYDQTNYDTLVTELHTLKDRLRTAGLIAP